MTTSRLLPSLWASFDELLDGLDDLPRQLLAPASPPLNVSEDAEAFYIEAELPGMTQEQLKIDIVNRTHVTLSGERPAGDCEAGRWHRRERGFGPFQRMIKLSAPVDADKVEARLENGVLRLVLPKADEARARRIVVKSE